MNFHLTARTVPGLDTFYINELNYQKAGHAHAVKIRTVLHKKYKLGTTWYRNVHKEYGYECFGNYLLLVQMSTYRQQTDNTNTTGARVLVLLL